MLLLAMMPIQLKTINFLTVFLTVVVVVFLRRWAKAARSHPNPLPPGPRGLPLLENILDMPQQKEWETFTDWARRFGE